MIIYKIISIAITTVFVMLALYVVVIFVQADPGYLAFWNWQLKSRVLWLFISVIAACLLVFGEDW